ncbi:MAG: radical SAM protein [Acutalibacteraceae bacterium]|nr:radical SAM protein [Acutalibacteraceae bacterium]
MCKHANISFFITHQGCPHRCSFCDQRSITGQTDLPTAQTVTKTVEEALENHCLSGKNTEIAFFGGSFTAIDRNYMLSLLEAAYPFVKAKRVCGIRISTRPDAIDEEILEILKKYGVTSIELGAQSMSDEVLSLNKRGHSAEDVYKACSLIKSYGFSLGLQMMTGLYKATKESDRNTVQEFIKLSPDTVRIYPTVVLKHTALAGFVEKGEYVPFSLEETIEQCCEYYEDFSKNGINVIRMGLHHINEEDYIAGPWHPAFSQLCMSQIILNKLIKEIRDLPEGEYIINVNASDISTFIGQKRSNLVKLKAMGYICSVKGDADINSGEFKLER